MSVIGKECWSSHSNLHKNNWIYGIQIYWSAISLTAIRWEIKAGLPLFYSILFVKRKIRMTEEWQEHTQSWKVCYTRKGNIKVRVCSLALTYPCELWKPHQRKLRGLLLSRRGKLWILASISVINIILPENLAKEWIRRIFATREGGLAEECTVCPTYHNQGNSEEDIVIEQGADPYWDLMKTTDYAESQTSHAKTHEDKNATSKTRKHSA